MKTSARKQLARRVRLLRTNRGWSQEVLAELSGLNRSYIGAVERAEHNIGLDNVERIAAALETSVTALLDNRETVQHPLPPCTGEKSPAKVFMELLRQCGQTHRELVLVYLERCGVTLRD